MHRRAVLVTVLTFAHMPAIALSTPRTPWGDPDLQGTWDFTTITALQRPSELAGKEFLTEREAAALERQINQQRVQTEEVSPGSLGGVPRQESDPGIDNLGWWWEPNGRRLVSTRRTSLVVDPALLDAECQQHVARPRGDPAVAGVHEDHPVADDQR